MSKRFLLLKKLDICSPFLALMLLLVVVLRIPNFLEPYWYGDEGIYLTIGNALNNGARLYTDIVDHKTPIIYYLARVGSQFNFRLLLLLWMLGTTSAFYAIAHRFFKNKWSANLATLFFVIMTTLPWLEGNIPNGELFVMGFVIFGFWILQKSTYFTDFLETKDHSAKEWKNKWTILALLSAGFYFGLGVLTKVPALLDFGAALVVGWFTITNSLLKHLPKNAKAFWDHTVQLLLQMVLLVAGFIFPIFLSILYFVAVGSGKDYLQFGLLYNLHYSGNWSLGFTNPLLQFLFTLPGKASIMALLIIAATVLRKWMTPAVQFITSWFILTLFASLLSNRPYPHYLLQIVPPAALLVGALLEKYKPLQRLTTIGSFVISFGLVTAVALLLNVGFYPTTSYYKLAADLLLGKISSTQYRDQFNYLLADNYAASQVIAKSSDKYLFVWGTDPMLYAMSKKQPTGRFTVSFHIIDLGVYDETFKDLEAKEPEYIVVMNDEQTPLPELDGFLAAKYMPNYSYQHFVLWRKQGARAL